MTNFQLLFRLPENHWLSEKEWTGLARGHYGARIVFSATEGCLHASRLTNISPLGVWWDNPVRCSWPCKLHNIFLSYLLSSSLKVMNISK